jgi:hypothetical protein
MLPLKIRRMLRISSRHLRSLTSKVAGGGGYALAKGDGPGVVVGPGQQNPNLFTQSFSIGQNEQYKIVAQASSVSSAQAVGHVQINWIDKDSHFITVTQGEFPVGPQATTFEYPVVAPSGAVQGFLYVIPGGTGEAVRYTEMGVVRLDPLRDFMSYRFFGIEGQTIALYVGTAILLCVGLYLIERMTRFGGRADKNQKEYRPDIDGLRAISIAAVVLFHAFPTKFSGGFVGVDVFFVISGFLISSIIFKGLADGSFSFANFYARRIMRIFPALIIVLAACIAFGVVCVTTR